MYGTNKVTQQDDHPGRTWLLVQRIFKTIQGEGPFAGTPAVFVRLGGCNLKCFWCDTDFESSEWKPHVVEVLNQVQALAGEGIKLVVLTGGEPLLQNVKRLIEGLNAASFTVQIETAGTVWWDWIPELFRSRGQARPGGRGRENTIVCSPKTPKLNEKLVPFIDAYKYIIRGEVSPKDGLPIESTQLEGAKTRIARPPNYVPAQDIYLQPCDESRDGAFEALTEENVEKAAKLAMQFGYRLSLQLHKIVGLP